MDPPLWRGGPLTLACGYWRITTAEAPEPFDLVMEADETISLVQGHLTIEVEGGHVYDLFAGRCRVVQQGRPNPVDGA